MCFEARPLTSILKRLVDPIQLVGLPKYQILATRSASGFLVHYDFGTKSYQRTKIDNFRQMTLHTKMWEYLFNDDRINTLKMTQIKSQEMRKHKELLCNFANVILANILRFDFNSTKFDNRLHVPRIRDNLGNILLLTTAHWAAILHFETVFHSHEMLKVLHISCDFSKKKKQSFILKTL